MSTSKEHEAFTEDSSLKETQYINVPKSFRVFISYSHDSPKQKHMYYNFQIGYVSKEWIAI